MHVLHGIVCRLWLYVVSAHYVYVNMVKEKVLGVCLVWKLIQTMYEIRKNVELKD